MIMPYASALDALSLGDVFHLSESGCAYTVPIGDERSEAPSALLAFLPGTTANFTDRTVTFPTGLTIEDGGSYQFGGGLVDSSEIDSPDVHAAYAPAKAACDRDGIHIGGVVYVYTASPVRDD